ncbi:TniB family NTP-binding protein [uncultured Sphingomonas sp.]|uniref:TniB family NTP-binding protein n=1 Tax=uncultured Sphingomonas sp. TaxID=158754 RepID=UPI0025E104EF|nr:TniB family NTP-binding protein [uncultured Sphingomonas sp.]
MSNRLRTVVFSPSELLPQTGSPQPDVKPRKLVALASRDQIIRSIYIQNPNHTPVFKSLDLVLSLGVKGVFQTGVRNAAPSFAGKSASADEFARIVERRETYPKETSPVVRVELEQACTSRRFWSTILGKYGDGFTASKDEEGLRRSTYDAFERHGTKLLIIDEVQHAGYRSKGSSAPTDVIKRFISDAQVGVGLFGNEQTLELLQSNNQLSHRLQEPCDIKPLDITEPSALPRFGKFLADYDDALIANKLFTTSLPLRDARVAGCLMTIASGFLGRVVTLLQIAGRRAFLRGATSIELHDLSHASTSWAVQQRLTPHDPFRFGIAGG